MIRLILTFMLLCAGRASAEEAWRTLPELPGMSVPAGSGTTLVNGARIFHAEYGKGPALVLLHGGLANSDWWANQVPAFAEHYHVVLIDSRGHGRSTRDAQPYTYELMMGDVLGVMDALKIPRASVVGWSDGGIVGLEIALHHPERLDRLVAFAANSDPSGVIDGTDKNPIFARFIARSGEEYRLMSPTPDGYAAFTAAIEKMWDTEPHFTGQLSRIHVPVAIMDGDHDEAIKRAHTEMLAQTIPGARLIILPGVSHFAMVQNPALFTAAVLGFLGGH